MPSEEVKIAQPVIVQYVAPHNMLWYAPYCTIGGATEVFSFQSLVLPEPTYFRSGIQNPSPLEDKFKSQLQNARICSSSNPAKIA